MTCGKLFLLREKGIALVKQDKWTCPLPPAPEGELTENSIRTRSSFSSTSTVVSKDKIKSQPQERTMYISCWLFRALFTGLAASRWNGKKERARGGFYVCNSLGSFFFFLNRKWIFWIKPMQSEPDFSLALLLSLLHVMNK